ncbi:hypothetical protein K8I31_21195 [bacterium]|nr:hypothetical protein [bacterium]
MNDSIAANISINHHRRKLFRDLRKLREYQSYWRHEYNRVFDEYGIAPNAMDNHGLIDSIFINRRELDEINGQILRIRNQLNSYE